jgi:prevent-host-death family protein
MTITVSVSQLRNNISEYLDRVSKGASLLVNDEKRGKRIAHITKAQTFDKDVYEKILRKVAGIFTAENHPEWKTKADVIAWVRKNRLANERKF